MLCPSTVGHHHDEFLILLNTSQTSPNVEHVWYWDNLCKLSICESVCIWTKFDWPWRSRDTSIGKTWALIRQNSLQCFAWCLRVHQKTDHLLFRLQKGDLTCYELRKPEWLRHQRGNQKTDGQFSSLNRCACVMARIKSAEQRTNFWHFVRAEKLHNRSAKGVVWV